VNRVERFVSITVTVTNDAPNASEDSYSVDEKGTISRSVLSNDSDPDGHSLTAQLTGGGPSKGALPGGLANNGSFTYDPAGDFTSLGAGDSEEVSFDYTVEDGFGGSDRASVTITVNGVNDPPTADLATAQTDEESPVFVDLSSNINDLDNANDALRIEVSDAPPTGTASTSGQVLTYDPDGDLDGLASGEERTIAVQYRVTDGDGGSAEASVNVTVEGRNDAPIASNDSYSTPEDAGTLSGNVLENDRDPDGDELRADLEERPDNGALSTFNDDGSFEFELKSAFDTLGTGETNTVEFRYTARDGNGREDQATATIEVKGENNPPTARAVGRSTDEDQSTTIDLSGAVSDPEDDVSALSVSVDDAPSNGTTSNDNPDDLKLTYVPDEDFNGTDQFSYQVEDSGGATATGTVEVTVNKVPDVVLAGGDDFGFSPNPNLDTDFFGTPVGVLRYDADETGASIEALTVTNSNPGVSGIKEVRLYSSGDPTLSRDDSSIDVVDTDPTDAPSTIRLDNFGVQVDTESHYLFVTLDLAENAPANDVRVTIDQPSDVQLGGGKGTIDREESGSFPLSLWDGPVTLPVELARFTAERTGEGIRLSWETASETNNAAFQVQRHVADGEASAETGSDASDWTTVGRREGAGTTVQPQSYQFTDADLPYAADSVRYRLRQIDTDGEAHLSDPVTVARGAVETVQLKDTYPNPASDQITVRYAVPRSTKGPVQLALYDVLGRQVRTVASTSPDGRSTRSVDVSGLSSGTYVLRLQAGSTAQTRRLTVVR